jgi:hypothetical protein
MSHSKNHEDTGATTAYYQGFDAGIKAEQERIINALRDKAATRTILPTVAAFFHIDELIETIREAQDD